VPVIVDVVSAPPAAGTDAWDQVVEASIGVPTARLIIDGPSSYNTPGSSEIDVPPGEAVREIADDGRVRLVQYDADSGQYSPLHDPTARQRLRQQAGDLGRDIFTRHAILVPDDAWCP
jgi:hypothetical protein